MVQQFSLAVNDGERRKSRKVPEFIKGKRSVHLFITNMVRGITVPRTKKSLEENKRHSDNTHGKLEKSSNERTNDSFASSRKANGPLTGYVDGEQSH